MKISSVCIFALPGCVGVDGVITTLADAAQREVFLTRLDTFIYDHFKWGTNDHLNQCVVNSNAFKTNCTDQGVTDSQCRLYECSNPIYANQSACEGSNPPSSWNQRGDAPDSQCCNGGSTECHYNVDGTDDVPCCDQCASGGTPSHAGQCTFEGYEGPSVCGTTAGTCYECLGSDPRWGPPTDESTCSMAGTCNISSHRHKQGCEQAGGNWTAAVWHHWTDKIMKADCTSLDYCGHCNNTVHTDEHTCISSGGEWLKEYIHEETCDKGRPDGYQWVEVRKFETGIEIPAAPMQNTECSTGPDHYVHVDHCMDPDQYFADAATFSFREAYRNDSSYYKDTFDRFFRVARAVVTNAANAVDRAAFGVANGCLIGILEPQNKGRINVNGRADGRTFIVIFRPTNYAEADSIVVRNASVAVIGGTSGGPIDLADALKVEVSGVNNSGDIIITRSQDIFISNVRNFDGAEIKAIDVTATLNHVTNEGRVLVKQGGIYRAYNLINNGVVQIEAGSISIHTICPSSGSLNISSGVSGNVSYEFGCMGTIIVDGVKVTQTLLDGGSVGGSVQFQQVVKKAQLITGSFDMNVLDADAFIADSVALNAVKEGIADNIGIDPSWFEVTAEKSRRLSDDSALRRLAGTTVRITYTISIPFSSSTAVATATQAQLESVTPTQLTTSVAVKMQQAKGNSYTVTITSTWCCTVEVATTTTPEPTSSSLAMTSTAPTPMTSSGDGNGDGSTTTSVATNTMPATTIDDVSTAPSTTLSELGATTTTTVLTLTSTIVATTSSETTIPATAVETTPATTGVATAGMSTTSALSGVGEVSFQVVLEIDDFTTFDETQYMESVQTVVASSSDVSIQAIVESVSFVITSVTSISATGLTLQQRKAIGDEICANLVNIAGQGATCLVRSFRRRLRGGRRLQTASIETEVISTDAIAAKQAKVLAGDATALEAAVKNNPQFSMVAVTVPTPPKARVQVQTRIVSSVDISDTAGSLIPSKSALSNELGSRLGTPVSVADISNIDDSSGTTSFFDEGMESHASMLQTTRMTWFCVVLTLFFCDAVAFFD